MTALWQPHGQYGNHDDTIIAMVTLWELWLYCGRYDGTGTTITAYRSYVSTTVPMKVLWQLSRYYDNHDSLQPWRHIPLPPDAPLTNPMSLSLVSFVQFKITFLSGHNQGVKTRWHPSSYFEGVCLRTCARACSYFPVLPRNLKFLLGSWHWHQRSQRKVTALTPLHSP